MNTDTATAPAIATASAPAASATQQFTLYRVFDDEQSYIGVTTNYDVRMKRHRWDCDNGTMQPALYRYIRGAGKKWKDMQKIKLRTWVCAPEEAYEAEREAIKTLGATLNTIKGTSYNPVPGNKPEGFAELKMTYDDPVAYHKYYMKHWRLANLDRQRAQSRELYKKNPDGYKRRYLLKTEIKRLRAIEIEPSTHHARHQRYVAETRRFRNISI